MRLNVIFHGFFVFLRRGDDFDALIPDVGNAHCYLAGRWLRETPIINKALELVVPRGRSDRLDPYENLLFVRADVNIDARFLRAVLHLPAPDGIASRGKLKPKDGCTVSSPLLHPRFRRFAATQVFQYSFSDIHALELQGHDWKPVFDIPERLVNLHVIAEPPGPAPHGHLQHMVHTLNSLLPNLYLRVDECLEPVQGDEPGPDGVIPAELQPIESRVDFIAEILRAHDLAVPRGSPPTCWGAGDDL